MVPRQFGIGVGFEVEIDTVGEVSNKARKVISDKGASVGLGVESSGLSFEAREPHSVGEEGRVATSAPYVRTYNRKLDFQIRKGVNCNRTIRELQTKVISSGSGSISASRERPQRRTLNIRISNQLVWGTRAARTGRLAGTVLGPSRSLPRVLSLGARPV